jgi:hypothetical protein
VVSIPEPAEHVEFKPQLWSIQKWCANSPGERHHPGEQSEQSLDAWDAVFGNPIIASALRDHLLHHSDTINIQRKTPSAT